MRQSKISETTSNLFFLLFSKRNKKFSVITRSADSPKTPILHRRRYQFINGGTLHSLNSKSPLIMSITLSTLFSKTPIKPSPPQFPPRLHQSHGSSPPVFSPLTKKAKPLNKLQISHSFYGSFKKSVDGFVVKAQNESGSVENGGGEEEMDVRGESSMPERFRYLTKEAPDKPVRWPLLIGKLNFPIFFKIKKVITFALYMHLLLAR